MNTFKDNYYIEKTYTFLGEHRGEDLKRPPQRGSGGGAGREPNTDFEKGTASTLINN